MMESDRLQPYALEAIFALTWNQLFEEIETLAILPLVVLHVNCWSLCGLAGLVACLLFPAY